MTDRTGRRGADVSIFEQIRKAREDRAMWPRWMREASDRDMGHHYFVRSMQRARIGLCQSKIRRLSHAGPGPCPSRIGEGE